MTTKTVEADNSGDSKSKDARSDGSGAAPRRHSCSLFSACQVVPELSFSSSTTIAPPATTSTTDANKSLCDVSSTKPVPSMRNLSILTRFRSFFLAAPTASMQGWVLAEVKAGWNRGSWRRSVDYPIMLIGVAVGHANVVGFPSSVHKHGGGDFLLAYVALLFLLGFPLFYLEACLGKFCSRGSARCWEMAPLFRGLGLAICITSSMMGVVYAVEVAVSQVYFVNSFRDPLPWVACTHPWNTRDCLVWYQTRRMFPFCEGANHTAVNGTCYDVAGRFVGVWNATRFVEETGRKVQYSAEEYYSHKFGGHAGTDLFKVGGQWRPYFVLSLFLVWLIVLLALLRGIQSLTMVVLCMMLVPYFVLFLLLATSTVTTVEGYAGLEYYLKPRLEAFGTATLWFQAAFAVLYQLTIGFGTVITLSSYCSFKGDPFRVTVLVVTVETVTSFLYGLVIFQFLGHMAANMGTSIQEVLSQHGFSLAYIVYPQSIPRSVSPSFESTSFFLSLVLVGSTSLIALTEVIVTAILDTWPELHERRKTCAVLVCLSGFCFGLPFTFRGGEAWRDLVMSASCTSAVINSLVEVTVLAWVYGVSAFITDIEIMANIDSGRFLKITWAYIVPPVLWMLLLLRLMEFPSYATAGEVFIASLFHFSSVLALTAGAVKAVVDQKKTARPDARLSQVVKSLLQPSLKWGPDIERGARPYPATINEADSDSPVHSDSILATAGMLDVKRHLQPHMLKASIPPHLDDVMEVTETTTTGSKQLPAFTGSRNGARENLEFPSLSESPEASSSTSGGFQCPNNSEVSYAEVSEDGSQGELPGAVTLSPRDSHGPEA